MWLLQWSSGKKRGNNSTTLIRALIDHFKIINCVQCAAPRGKEEKIASGFYMVGRNVFACMLNLNELERKTYTHENGEKSGNMFEKNQIDRSETEHWREWEWVRSSKTPKSEILIWKQVNTRTLQWIYVRWLRSFSLYLYFFNIFLPCRLFAFCVCVFCFLSLHCV